MLRDTVLYYNPINSRLSMSIRSPEIPVLEYHEYIIDIDTLPGYRYIEMDSNNKQEILTSVCLQPESRSGGCAHAREPEQCAIRDTPPLAGACANVTGPAAAGRGTLEPLSRRRLCAQSAKLQRLKQAYNIITRARAGWLSSRGLTVPDRSGRTREAS